MGTGKTCIHLGQRDRLYCIAHQEDHNLCMQDRGIFVHGDRCEKDATDPGGSRVTSFGVSWGIAGVEATGGCPLWRADKDPKETLGPPQDEPLPFFSVCLVPQYLCNLLLPYTPTHSLRSSDSIPLIVPRHHLSSTDLSVLLHKNSGILFLTHSVVQIIFLNVNHYLKLTLFLNVTILSFCIRCTWFFPATCCPVYSLCPESQFFELRGLYLIWVSEFNVAKWLDSTSYKISTKHYISRTCIKFCGHM